uniref:EF-hand calcium binding domain 2 n=1 Tax=Calidris pygmaea TaxID=425635 RepID=A0A8C3PKS6_9CHAR
MRGPHFGFDPCFEGSAVAVASCLLRCQRPTCRASTKRLPSSFTGFPSQDAARDELSRPEGRWLRLPAGTRPLAAAAAGGEARPGPARPTSPWRRRGAAAMAEKEGSGEDDAVAEIEKKIMEAFEVFDHECNKTVDVREIGSIVRSLGCFPTEAELHELLAKVEEEEPTGYIHLEKFLPVMTKVLLDRSYRPIPEDVLLHAFEALDENKCGYITKEDLVKYLTEEGEPFTQEEMEDMLSAALDPETNTVRYRDYISMMVVDES